MAVVLVLLMQGPAMLVQEVAWAKMLMDYTSERGFKRGVIETFDGKHPCKLCAKAKELRDVENGGQPAERRPQERQVRMAWTEMIPVDRIRIPVAVGREIVPLPPTWSRVWRGRGADAPPLPPPEEV